MRTDNADFAAQNLAKVKTPRYIIAVSWDTANTDIIYLSSHSDSTILNPRGNNVVTGNRIEKVGGVGAWDSDCYSSDSYTNGAYVSFTVPQNDKAIIIGLNTDPTTDQSYTSIDYSWYCNNAGNYDIYESGTPKSVTGAYSAGDIFTITYDGSTVRYYHNGVEKRSVAASAGLTFYLDSSFNAPGGIADVLAFGPGPVNVSNVISSISGASQKIDPINARSTIGNISCTLIDDGITEIINDKLIDGDGLRGKRVIFYAGYEGLEWDDYVIIQTQVIDGIQYSDGEYIINCSDIQRSMREDIFDLAETNITANIGLTDTTINVVDTSDFEMYEHGTSYTDAPSATVGYFRIGDTIYRYTGKTSTTFTGVTQGALNTKPAVHEISTTADADRQPKVTEIVYLEMPAVKLAYAILTGNLYNQAGKELPSGWHLNISTNYVATSKFISIGLDLWDPADDTKGKIVKFIGLEKQDGKKFIEKEIYLLLGLFSPVLNDGQLSLDRMAGILWDAPYVALLDDENIISHGELTHDMASVYNQFQIDWNYDLQEEEFTRHDVLIDAASIATHGTAKPYVMEFRGLDGYTHTQATLAHQRDSARDRYTGPPLRLSVTCLPSMNRLEVGDVVRVTLSSIKDYSNSPSTSLDRSFEIQNVAIDWISGQVKLDLFGSSQRASLISATSAATVLSSGFYTSAGTNLTSVLTISGGAVTANGNIAGGTDLTTAIYYYDGDLTINTGVTVTLNNNIQLRIKGELTINGTLDGVGRGLSGATGGAGTAGTVGGFGVTKAGNGINASAIYNYITTRSVSPLEGLNSIPYYAVDWDGTTISGLPTDLRGSSGGAGGDVHHIIISPVLVATGGDGGDGGAGLCIICRGVSFGINGNIDLSGNAGSSGGSYNYNPPPPSAPSLTYQFKAGSGAGGSPGGLLVLLDGAAVNEPDISDLILDIGNSPDASSTYVVSGNTYTIQSARGYPSQDQRNSAYRSQRLAENLTPQEDIPRLTSIPTGISLVEVTNTPPTPTENLASIEVTVTPPSDGNYSFSKVYYKLTAQTAWQFAGVASDEAVIVVSMDGSTYDVKANPVSISGVESDQYISDSITVSTAAGGVVLGSGNYIKTSETVGQTNSPEDGQGIEVTDTHLKAYDSTGTARVIIDATTGLITATNVTLTGNITATTGTIGGWSISGDTLVSGDISLDAGNTRIQAGPTGSTYVRMSPDGIVGVDSVLGTTFDLPTDGSAPTFSSGIINSTIFNISTSGILRTSATVGDGSGSGQGVLINNTGIKGYKASYSTPTFHLDATDGTVTLSGSSTTGGHIKGGQTDYDTGTGFFMGYSSAYKFSIGDSAGSRLTWNGTTLSLYDSSNELILNTGGSFHPEISNDLVAISLNPRGNNVVTGNRIEKVGGASSWDSDCYSSDAHTNGAYVSFTFPQNDKSIIIGLNTDPTTDQSYTSIDYSWYGNSAGNYDIYESGTPKSVTGAYSAGDIFTITYDGSTVRYYHNGVEKRSVAASAGLTFYLDSSFNAPGGIADVLGFGPMTGLSGGVVITGNATGASINVNSTTYGSSGVQIQYNGGTPRMYIGDGSNTFMNYEDGELTVRTLKTSTSGKRIELNPASDNELHFYGVRNDSESPEVVEELATIGIRTSGSDRVIGYFGSFNSSRMAVRAESNDENTILATLWGAATLSAAVTGAYAGAATEEGYGIWAEYNSPSGSSNYGGPLVISCPSATSAAPNHTAKRGTLWVTSTGVLYINTDNSTTWAKVGAQ